MKDIIHFRSQRESLYQKSLYNKITLKIISKYNFFFSNRVLSSIHGFVLGTSALNLLLFHQVWANDIFGQFPVILDYLFCFSAGYEVYDLGTMILQDFYVKKSKVPDSEKQYNDRVFWVHHSSMILGYAIAMVNNILSILTHKHYINFSFISNSLKERWDLLLLL